MLCLHSYLNYKQHSLKGNPIIISGAQANTWIHYCKTMVAEKIIILSLTTTWRK